MRSCSGKVYCKKLTGGRSCQYKYSAARTRCASAVTDPCDLHQGTCSGYSTTCSRPSGPVKNAPDGTGCLPAPKFKLFKKAFSTQTAAVTAGRLATRRLSQASDDEESAGQNSADEVTAATFGNFLRCGVCRRGKCVVKPLWFCI